MLKKGRDEIKQFFYYFLFPYILFMRGLSRVIKTEAAMSNIFLLCFVPVHILIIGYGISESLFLEVVSALYLFAGLFAPMLYFDSDVRRAHAKPDDIPHKAR